MEKYNFKIIESKWHKLWEEKKIFKAEKNLKKKKILLPRNVSLPIWKNPYGTRPKLCSWRRIVQVQKTK